MLSTSNLFKKSKLFETNIDSPLYLTNDKKDLAFQIAQKNNQVNLNITHLKQEQELNNQKQQEEQELQQQAQEELKKDLNKEKINKFKEDEIKNNQQQQGQQEPESEETPDETPELEEVPEETPESEEEPDLITSKATSLANKELNKEKINNLKKQILSNNPEYNQLKQQNDLFKELDKNKELKNPQLQNLKIKNKQHEEIIKNQVPVVEESVLTSLDDLISKLN
jgi:hypothetical protein